jgi:hypothetical protein
MTEKKYPMFGVPPREAPRGSMKDVRASTPASSPRTTSIPSRARTPSTAIAPERDFQRVPNSVTKHAMAAGLFRGKSKQVYDYLWSVSRGAIVPARRVRKSRKEIKAGSGLGSMVTVDAAIDHLLHAGLLSVKPAVGSLIGNTYEIFTPEEASTRTPSISSTTSLTHNLVDLDEPESSSTRTTQSLDSKASSSNAKTSFKTREENLDDDAALAGLVAELKVATKDLTGKEVSVLESDRWRELAQVLVAELKIAAARTTVSSVPSFLAEHLRRRLWKIDKKQARAEGRELPDEPVSAQPGADTSGCKDCSGSGWWYPEGPERGVSKCKHEGLVREGNEQP